MVKGSKVLKVELAHYGSYLGRSEGCFEIRDKTGKIERYPHFKKEIGEAVLKSGSYVSVDALIDLALWNIDTYVVTRRNRVVALLKNVEDDSHVKTRLCQYEAVLDNEKCMEIAKQFILAKIKGQSEVLKKYNLDYAQNSNCLIQIESFHPLHYRKSTIQPDSLSKDEINHLLNLFYRNNLLPSVMFFVAILVARFCQIFKTKKAYHLF